MGDSRLDKMVRFLKSIGIENVDDFDLSFDLCARNPFSKDQIDMVIVKKTPWKYHLLRKFQDGLNTIAYKYTLAFSYIERPTYLDVLSLFDDWFQTLYRYPSPLYISGIDNKLTVQYENDEQCEQFGPVINDFKDFLNFLYYDFQIIEITKQGILEPEISFTKEEKQEIEKKAELQADEDIEMHTSSTSSIDIHLDQLDEEEVIDTHQEEAQQVEDALLKQMKANAARLKKDRELARRNKRGNYSIIDSIDAIDENVGNVDFVGYIFSKEEKSYDQKISKVIYGINDDFAGAIFVNMSVGSSFDVSRIKELAIGSKVRVRGCPYYDEFQKALMIKGHYIDILPPDEIQIDKAKEKRVELHIHSKMSAMDATGSMMEYAKYAKALGMKALAITDHGVVSGFPDAQKAAKKTGLKMLYGCEFYMVDDKLEYIKNPSDLQLNHANYVVFDLETTGLSCRYNRIIEFGAVRIEKGVEVARLDLLINPEVPIPSKIVKITKITDKMVQDKPTFLQVKDKILDFLKDAILVSHNADFDVPFLNESLIRINEPILTNPVIDTLALSRYLFPNARNHRLGTLCRNFEVHYDEDVAHRADYDASVLNDVWQVILAKMTKDNRRLRHCDLQDLKTNSDMLKHIHPYHMIALAKNYDGLHDLYRLISMSHIDYLADIPKIPRSEIQALRTNLILGSGCFNSDIFEIAAHKNIDSLKKAIKFYDYIEIQPLDNYCYQVNRGNFETIDDVKNILSDIVKISDELGVMVCATGDVHYCLPKHKIFRDVYISAKGLGGVYHPLNLNPYGKADIPNYENPNQHFLTTDEMLEAMSFLGKEKAYEISVTNTNKIADMIEEIVPLPNDHLYTPKIDNCEEMLRKMCFDNAHKLYGDPLPEFIEKRLDVELNGIISNGYSVIYYIAHKIVKKANEDGYLVGSRGSVGSSFVATMADITEVNPLPPHYRCPKCKHLEWTLQTYPDIKTGFDLPIKRCPVCGEIMIGDGQNIPFETFLGFKAEKTPDIDLNFPGDYQARAHDYTKVLLGEENVFRAGTIETVAEKTAFGYARGYFERLGINPDTISRAKISYLASGCVDVRRTTGQHPGGIVVIPKDHEVYDFTPVQYPANKPDASWKTTHFDFRSMHDTILKLDLLGHVDPVALKMMADLTGIDVKTIPMNDAKVLSLFSSVDALEMKGNYLNQKTGALAIPEFGTDFVRGMLESTNPKTFADLVIISGLSHGTDVWNGNAEKLIESKIATLKDVIGCRDDIMTYLISKGLPSDISFAIMEDVRHGYGLKEEYVQIMLANHVPQYYIDSCNKIKYMFPKGHATAYVMMAVRVGYFKVYYPLEFYATFFSVRSDQWDIQTMIKGQNAIMSKLDELKMKNRTHGVKLTPKEDAILKTLQVAIEMVQRGYKFENLDLYKSEAKNFVVNHENKSLIPPFVVIDGLGENAAESVIEARKEGEFTSKEDLLRRTKLNGTNVKDLESLGVLDNLNESDQLTLFDF